MPRDSSKPKGRTSAYSFFVQVCRMEHKKKHPDESVVFSEFSKKCGEQWKIMSENDKKRFREMAERDKKRYDLEMEDYVPPKNKDQGRKRRQKKDPNAPKRPLTAFFWFSNDERANIKGKNPEYGIGEIAKELGRMWKEVGPDVKRKYEKMAERDKTRYQMELTSYSKRAKQGAAYPDLTRRDEDEDDEDEEEDDDDEGDDE